MSTVTFDAASDRSGMLRRVLMTDGFVSGSIGVVLAIFAGMLSEPLGLPTILIRLVGLSLLPFSASLLYLYSRVDSMRSAVWGIVGLNLLWVAASIMLLLSGWVDPTGLGIGFIIAQALMVAIFAELQYIGLKRSA